MQYIFRKKLLRYLYTKQIRLILWFTLTNIYILMFGYKRSCLIKGFIVANKKDRARLEHDNIKA